MVAIVYVHPDGREQVLDVKPGENLMQAAVDEDIREIIGECGGYAMCATCHVFVDEADLARVPPVLKLEDEMLAGIGTERKPNSRLCCQIVAAAGLEGLRVYLPVSQI